jgi:hypothetical protein
LINTTSATLISSPTSANAFQIEYNGVTRGYQKLVATGQAADFVNLVGTVNNINTWISGDDGNDHLITGSANDCLLGGDGNDILTGNAGADILDGGSGTDSLTGAGGDDTLSGGDGNDTLNGGDNNDILDGGSGNDTLNGGNNDDTLFGGDGIDTLTGGLGTDQFNWINNGSNDVITDFTISQADTIGLANIFSPAPPTVPGAIDAGSFQTAASTVILSSMVLDGKITRLTVGATMATINGLTVNPAGSTAQNGYVLFFDNTSGVARGQLVYDDNWRNTGNRQVCFTFSSISNVTALNNMTAAQFEAF